MYKYYLNVDNPVLDNDYRQKIYHDGTLNDVTYLNDKQNICT